jgi:hypothetical protein
MSFISSLTTKPVSTNYLQEKEITQNLPDIESSLVERIKRPIVRKDDFNPLKKIALKKDDLPVAFKVPYKPSKKEDLNLGEFMIAPVSSSYEEAKMMALYLHKMSIKKVDDFRNVLMIFNHCKSHIPKKSKINSFLLNVYPSMNKSASLYKKQLKRSLNTQVPENIQVYMFKENVHGISMIKRQFPLPDTHRLRILRSTIGHRTYYSVIIKKKDFQDII